MLLGMPVCARKRLSLLRSVHCFVSAHFDFLEFNRLKDPTGAAMAAAAAAFSRRKVFSESLTRGARVKCFFCWFFLCISTHFRSSCCSTCGLVQREQRLHVVFLALDFVWSFQDARFNHRLRPAWKQSTRGSGQVGTTRDVCQSGSESCSDLYFGPVLLNLNLWMRMEATLSAPVQKLKGGKMGFLK